MLNKIGGAILGVGLVVSVVLSYQTPTGKAFWSGLWQAVKAVGTYVADNIPGTPAAGNLLIAAAVGAVAALAAFAFFEGMRHGWRFGLLVVAVALLVVVPLYAPDFYANLG